MCQVCQLTGLHDDWNATAALLRASASSSSSSSASSPSHPSAHSSSSAAAAAAAAARCVVPSCTPFFPAEAEGRYAFPPFRSCVQV
mmetsp:Transcript_12611/g.24259  ORF Transcript_12611/g.24259 Transcript_12611/m.24259 type:complete len:86 (+) Transcript_12611:1262-1519(+)